MSADLERSPLMSSLVTDVSAVAVSWREPLAHQTQASALWPSEVALELTAYAIAHPELDVQRWFEIQVLQRLSAVA